MKKILLLGGLLLCSGLALGQTSNETPSTPPATVDANTVSQLELLARNIDRRLMYFNRYKKSNDLASLAKLISDENKDFYTNFTNYVKAAPLFTLKRDTSAKIVKTPTEEYAVSVIVTTEGVDRKASMTFIEETSETGNIWLIIDSNLHIQGAPKSGSNLASNTLTRPTPRDPDPKSSTNTPDIATNTGGGTVATLPVITKPAPETAPNASAPPQITAPKGLGNTTLIIIAVAIIISIGLGVFGLIQWRHKHTTLATAVAATAAFAASNVTQTPHVSTPPENPPTTLPVPPIDSNVTVSTVENISDTAISGDLPTEESPVSDAITYEETSPSTEFSDDAPQETLPIVETEIADTVSAALENSVSEEPAIELSEPEPIVALGEPQEEILETSPVTIEETISTVSEEPTFSEQDIATESSVSEMKDPASEVPLTEVSQEEKPLSELFTQGEETPQSPEQLGETQPVNDASKALLEEKLETPPVSDEPHPLFESALNPSETPNPQTGGLFADILKSEG